MTASGYRTLLDDLVGMSDPPTDAAPARKTTKYKYRFFITDLPLHDAYKKRI